MVTARPKVEAVPCPGGGTLRGFGLWPGSDMFTLRIGGATLVDNFTTALAPAPRLNARDHF